LDIYHRDNARHLARRLAGAHTVVTVSAHNVAHLEDAPEYAGDRGEARKAVAAAD